MKYGNVGIVALEFYFPSQYVNQIELEKFDGVSSGKYTIGLGQNNMSFVNDTEDVVSMSYTVTCMLLEKYRINKFEIGKIDVSTETAVDKSKSIKSFLMKLFEDSDSFLNYGQVDKKLNLGQVQSLLDIEGCDSIHACYGGTNAVLNAVSWLETPYFKLQKKKKYALVVCTDISLYPENSNARATGGCGTCAILLGHDAPLVLSSIDDLKFHQLKSQETLVPLLRASYSRHAYDFYKPVSNPEPFPIVDGHLSNNCYLTCLDQCYTELRRKYEQIGVQIDIKTFHYFTFHAPYNKLVQKAYAALLYNDIKYKLQKSLMQSSLSQLSLKHSTLSSSHRPILSDEKSNINKDELFVLEYVESLCSDMENSGNCKYEKKSEEEKEEKLDAVRQMLQFIGSNSAEETDFALNAHLQKVVMQLAKDSYNKRVNPSCSLTKEIGNTYTASLYAGICSLVSNMGKDLEGKTILCFSYGSGYCSTLYVMRGQNGAELMNLQGNLDLENRLNSRIKLSAQEFTKILQVNCVRYRQISYRPSSSLETLFPGTFYLEFVDKKWRRYYRRKQGQFVVFTFSNQSVHKKYHPF